MTVLLGATLALMSLVASQAPTEWPRVTHYQLALTLHPADRRMEGDARMRIRNTTARPLTEVPFLLYRLFDVAQAADGDGRTLAFRAIVARMRDHERYQVVSVVVALSESLAPGDSTEVRLRYGGPFVGATEVYPYLHDQVSEAYSLIRSDIPGYPILGTTAWAGVAPSITFTWQLTVTVPAGYRVATGGVALPPAPDGDRIRYRFVQTSPTWRLDIAAAPFHVLRDEPRRITAHFLGPDSTGARRVVAAAARSTELLERWFGTSEASEGFTVIEIPEGWGSQAGTGYLLQAGGAFRDAASIPEVYHEVGHGWNAPARPDLQATRWFDEAFASYYQALVMGEEVGIAARDAQMERWRDSFRRSAARNSLRAITPIGRYGEAGLGGLSYTKGAWSLHVLHLAMGDERFRRVIRAFLAEHRTRAADFDTFQRIAAREGEVDAGRWMAEWITGAESSRLLIGDTPAAAIASRYAGEGRR